MWNDDRWDGPRGGGRGPGHRWHEGGGRRRWAGFGPGPEGGPRRGDDGPPPPPRPPHPEGPGGFGPGGFGGFGPGGFGPGGFGPGGFGGFGPGGPGRGGRGWGRRRGRGNVRAAVLALLAEGPRHGYAVMNDLAERSGGLWRPSPGSVYPVLQQLQDEGLIAGSEAEGKRVYALTPAGEQLVRDNPEEYAEPWSSGEAGPQQDARALLESLGAAAMAARQVAQLGGAAQVEQARAVLDEARRSLYRILAEDGTTGAGTAQG